MNSSGSGIRITRQGGVLRLMLDSPTTLNAATSPMLECLIQHLDTASLDDAIRAVVITGAGRAFCSGADLGALEREPDGGARILAAAKGAITRIQQLGKPVVAAVNGMAVGFGCSLAVACDLVIATSSTSFVLAFAKVGLMPDGGATALLAAAVGRPRAMRMALLSEKIPAHTAADWGLIYKVVDDADFDNAVDNLLAELAAGPTQAYGRTKLAINVNSVSALAQVLDHETAGQLALFDSEEFAARSEAFRTRHTPPAGRQHVPSAS